MKRWIAMLGMLAALSAHAQGGQVFLMRVDVPAGARLETYEDGNGCPERADACRANGSVQAGEELLVTEVRGEWSRAWSKGWVRNAQLSALPVDAQPAWEGRWKGADTAGAIAIARKDDAYGIEAVIDAGRMQGPLRVDGKRARYDEGNPLMPDIGCKADFARLGRYLVVQDNGQCGGTVRFDGVYTPAE